jgi:hypothetical protein
MLAFKVESWIWYSVVLLIAISRLYDSHVHSICTTLQHNPSPKARKQIPIAAFNYQAQMQKTDKTPNAAFRAAWPLAPSVDTRPTNTS